MPDLTKPRQKKEGQPPSALSNFDVPQYEEILGYSNKWQLGMPSASATPRLSAKRGQVEKARPRIPLQNITAFHSIDENNNADKNTEKWVEEQNTLFEKRRENQGDEVPPRFEPKGPITTLQRRH